MIAKVIKSSHSSLHAGMIGRVLQPTIDERTGISGFEVAFEDVEVYDAFTKGKKPTSIFMKGDEIELLADTNAIPEQELQPTDKAIAAAAAEKAKAVPERSCCEANPLLKVVLCQLPRGHKGQHRSEATLLAKSQTFLWQ